MRIAYGTYAMPDLPLEQAAPLLAEIGYDGVEICVSPGHAASMPEEMDAGRRRRLRELLGRLGLGVPAVFTLAHALAEDEDGHRRTQEHVKRCAGLARDLGPEPPVVALGIGGRKDQWEQLKGRIVDHLGDYGRLARQEGFLVAAEAHCRAAVDRSERALWVIESVASPAVRLHFDIVHFYLAGEDETEAVERLLPITGHTHVTDARRHDDGSFDLLLLGQGDLDAAAYVKAMAAGGWEGFLTLEVSGRIWGRDDYDAAAAARISYDSMTGAFREANVERG